MIVVPRTRRALVDLRPPVAPVVGLPAQLSEEPNPAFEAAQLKSLRELATFFEDTCAATLGGRKWFAHFENWLWASREGAGEEAVVVVCGDGEDPELIRKLRCGGASEASAKETCARLGARAALIRKKLDEQRLEGGDVQVRRQGSLYQLSCKGELLLCGEQHLSKLYCLYNNNSHETVAPEESKRLGKKRRREEESALAKVGELAVAGSLGDFNARAFCALARVMALQGGVAQCGGMQAACPPAVFDFLRARYKVNCELFASPLNARFGVFCSAAVDVDAAFGSRGSFFNCRPTEGSFLANPPFVENIVLKMAHHMEDLLKAGDLTFVVVIPHWPERESWRLLKKMARTYVHLERAKHGYLEGGQQYKQELWRPATHDSSVFLLQSNSAFAASTDSDNLQAGLKQAFRTPPPALATNDSIMQLHKRNCHHLG